MEDKTNKVLDVSNIVELTPLNETSEKPLMASTKSNDQIQALADKVRERVDHYDSKAAPKDPYAGQAPIGYF